jgi:DNA-binding transcriptional LysR family regulator
MDFRIRQLQCFLVLSETLNYGQAAKRLYMAQPTLSFQIKSLEEDFGAKFFDRNRQGVELTTAGESFVPSARRILSEIQSAHRQIHGKAKREPLRVCCSQAGQFVTLPNVMRRLSGIGREVQAEWYSMVPEERISSLVSGKLDALMMVAPLQIPGVAFQQLRTESLVAALPAQPRYTSMKEISIYDFAQSPLLVSNEQDCRHCKQFSLSIMTRFGLVPRLIEAPVNLNIQFALVAAGQGVAFASEALLAMRFPGVVLVPFKEDIPRSKLGMAWRQDDVSSSLKLFQEVLSKTVEDCA